MKQRAPRMFFVAAESTTYTYLIQKLFILIVQYACVVNIVIIIGICSLIELKYAFSTPAAPGRHPIPPDHATAPSRTHIAALAIPAKERASQPNSASDDFSKLLSRTWQEITTFSVGSTVERPILDREHQLTLPVSAFSIFSAVRVLYYCTRMVGSWVVDG